MLNQSKTVTRMLRFSSMQSKKPPSKYGPPTWEYHGKEFLKSCLLMGAAGGALGLLFGLGEIALSPRFKDSPKPKR